MDGELAAFDNSLPEVSSYEDYENLKAKQRASVLWLLSKAYNHDIPVDLREPFYKGNDDQDKLKPQITHSLANAELYCLALANIYSDPNYHCLNHHGIIQILMRKGIFLVDPHDTSLTETVLMQTAPIKMSAHLVIIEAIMSLYIKEVLIPEKIVEVISRFTQVDPEEFPEDAEDAALFWINKSCVKLKQMMEREVSGEDASRSEPVPSLPILEDLTDMSDGCCLAALLSFYCPNHLRWREICLNKEMSMADSIYNLQLVQFFCQEKLPQNICFLSLEDFLYLHETIRPNVLAFIADLLFMFEIRRVECVRLPGIDDSESPELNEPNGSVFSYPDLPTPAEMKAKSLQHSSWVDENVTFAKTANDYNSPAPVRPPRKNSAKSRKKSELSSTSYERDEEDEELTRYFSALDIKTDVDAEPEILMIPNNDSKLENHKNEPFSLAPHINNKDFSDEFLTSSSPVKVNESNKPQLADYFAQLSSTSPSKTSNTSFAKLISENSNTFAINSNSKPAINIAYTKRDKEQVMNNHNSNNYLQKTNEIAAGVPSKINSNARSIIHVNESGGVKELLEQQSVRENNTPNYTMQTLQTAPSPSDSEIASQVHNIRILMEEKRKRIEQERKLAEEQWKSQKQDIGKEAFFKVMGFGGQPSRVAGDVDALYLNSSAINGMPSSRPELLSGTSDMTFAAARTNSLFPPPQIQQPLSPVHSNLALGTVSRHREPPKETDSPYFDNEHKLGQRTFVRSSHKLNNSESELENSKNEPFLIAPNNSQSPGVGFINSDPMSEAEMNRKKELIMMHSLKRRAEQEAKRRQEQELVQGNMQNNNLHFDIQNYENFNKPDPGQNQLRRLDYENENMKQFMFFDISNRNDQETYSQNNAQPLESIKVNSNTVNSVSPGVGFVIGADLVNSDPTSEAEMVKRKELIMMHSLKRRAEQEAKRIAKEQELAHKREEERIKQEYQERKREEEKLKRQMILEQYRQRKQMEEQAEKDIGGVSQRNRNNNTMVLNRSRQKSASGGKPRPKSLHVSSSNIYDFTSLDCKPSRIMDDVDASYLNSSTINGTSTSRPQSSMSGASGMSFGTTTNRLSSPTQTQQLLPSLPPGLVLGRHRGPPSETDSTYSEYNGPKLFVKPSQKSNKVLVLNAINVVLAGVVNSALKKKVIEEINACDSKHYLILFRNSGLQFRAIYSYNPDQEEVVKLHGTGPKNVYNEMIDKFYKYNSGSKSFNEIQTKHLTVTIDAFTIHNNLWAGKKVIPKKDYL